MRRRLCAVRRNGCPVGPTSARRGRSGERNRGQKIIEFARLQNRLLVNSSTQIEKAMILWFRSLLFYPHAGEKVGLHCAAAQASMINTVSQLTRISGSRTGSGLPNGTNPWAEGPRDNDGLSGLLYQGGPNRVIGGFDLRSVEPSQDKSCELLVACPAGVYQPADRRCFVGL